MKKKLIISIILCLLAIFAFAVVVSAEEAACEHSYDGWTVAFGENGYLGEMTASAKCTKCNAAATENIPALFITKGYSNSNDGVMQDYGVNREALAKYESLSGETLKFGAVVALKESIGGKNPLNNKGEPISSKVKTFDYTETEYNVISVAIKGIPENVKSSSGLLCALYVNAGGRTTYLDNCAEKVECGAKTFNEIEAVPEKDVTTLDKVEIIDGKRYRELTLAELSLEKGKYWNGTSMQSSNNLVNNFFATKKFTKETLPIGSIITIKSEDGWQYRPHKWNGTRPNTTKTTPITVTEEWWGSYTYVGFSISMDKDMVGANNTTTGLDNISAYTVEDIAEIFKIYVPVTYVDDTTGGDNEGGTTEPETPVNPPVDPTPGEGGEGGNEGGDDVIVPELPDYSAEKQNWQDDGELKILAIGNSFSDDAMEYVYQVAKDTGIEKVTLGKLYIGGCSLATHLANAQANKSAYDYKINTNGTWVAQGNKSIKFAVESDDWDFITFQQVSGQSGIASTYDDLYELIKIVEPLNPSARLAWHMTWAYKDGSGHQDFPKYNKDQMTMYNAIVNAVNTKILTIDNIEIVIPSGTAVQNVRTSFIGDTTRDGYHLSYGIGRYIAAMTYVKALTGLSIDNSITRPDDVDSYELQAIIESVNNAIDTPYAVTNSSFPTKDATQGGDDSANVGVIPEGFVQLTATQMGLTGASYYNTEGAATWNDPNDSWARCFVATKKFTREELPVGSIIEIASGWQYRPEGWAFANSRPGNVTTLRIIVDEDWWGSYSERGFNISMVGNSTNNHKEITLSTEEIANTIFKIYVPASVAPDVEEPETPVNPPVDPTPGEGGNEGGTTDPSPDEGGTDTPEESDPTDGLVLVEYMDWLPLSYWNPTDGTNHSIRIDTASNSKQFWATRTFTKEQLPVGSVIVIGEKTQYRVLNWKTFGQKGTRSDQIKTSVIVIDEAWWGQNTVKAFNISFATGGSMESVTEEQINNMFKIYVPESAAELNKEPENGGDDNVGDDNVEEITGVKSEYCVSEITVINGKEYRALTIEAMELLQNAYYYSTNYGSAEIYETGTSGTPAKFYATGIFDKELIVDGSIIYVGKGWQYRPEGWQKLDGKNTASRPGNISTTYVTVDSDWWGNYNYRGFNISKTNSGSLVNVEASTIYENFKIYIPVDKIVD